MWQVAFLAPDEDVDRVFDASPKLHHWSMERLTAEQPKSLGSP